MSVGLNPSNEAEFDSADFDLIAIERVTPAIGAEVRGVRLEQIDDAVFAEISRALVDRKVLVFPDQHSFTPKIWSV